jgi:geranylgeranyl diphosphate synthase type II
MDAMTRIEQALALAVARAGGDGCPPALADAVHHAVFPRGGRIRPKLSLAVAYACGDDQPGLSDAAAASIELLHCASLVHDDLPCFDDAAVRRGKPSVHAAYGEPLAVLAGDALIVLAFETLARAGACAPQRLGSLVMTVGRAVGMPSGIVAGQAWECEPTLDLVAYHRAKTGSLFVGAAMAGAIAAGAPSAGWRILGERLGEAYQVADDIRDVACDPLMIGKPVGQDEAHGRASAVRSLGLEGAIARLRRLVAEAVDSIPVCPRAGELRAMIRKETEKFLPEEIARLAA